jgi:hypothetical protein
MSANGQPEPVLVQLFEAKPNKLFTPEHTALVCFLRYSAAVPCAECGKRSRHQWTVLYSFKAKSASFLIPRESEKVHPPLTPVCRNHLLAPAALPPPPKKEPRRVKATG